LTIISDSQKIYFVSKIFPSWTCKCVVQQTVQWCTYNNNFKNCIDYHESISTLQYNSYHVYQNDKIQNSTLNHFVHLLYCLLYLHNTAYVKSFEGENFHVFHGFLLTMNVLPLKIFLEYRHCPLTIQRHGTTWSYVLNCKSFPYILSFIDKPRKFPPRMIWCIWYHIKMQIYNSSVDYTHKKKPL